jgi:hypothetical protein
MTKTAAYFHLLVICQADIYSMIETCQHYVYNIDEQKND